MCFSFCRECQGKDWSEHKLKCKPNVSVPVAVPFVISLPASQLTYGNLAQYAEQFSRYNACMCAAHSTVKSMYSEKFSKRKNICGSDIFWNFVVKFYIHQLLLVTLGEVIFYAIVSLCH